MAWTGSARNPPTCPPCSAARRCSTPSVAVPRGRPEGRPCATAYARGGCLDLTSVRVLTHVLRAPQLCMVAAMSTLGRLYCGNHAQGGDAFLLHWGPVVLK